MSSKNGSTTQSSTNLTIPADANATICIALFQPSSDVDSIHNVYAVLLQLFVTTLFAVGMGIRYLITDLDYRRRHEGGGVAGDILRGNYGARLAFGFGFLVAAWLKLHHGGLSNRHLRIALALASLYGAQSIIIISLLFKSIWIKRRWFYLAIYAILLIGFTVEVVIHLHRTGAEEQKCTANSLVSEQWGTYKVAIATSVTTPIWLILATCCALFAAYLTDMTESIMRRNFIMANTFVLTYAFIAAQVYYIFNIRHLYEQPQYALALQTTVMNETKGTLDLNSNLGMDFTQLEAIVEEASLAQIVTYIIAVLPLMDLVITLFQYVACLSREKNEDEQSGHLLEGRTV